MHRGLRGRVRIGLERRHADPVDGADVDHPGRVLLGSRLAKQGHQELGQVEDALHVEGEHALERGLVELLEGRAPGGAGVVDQDVEGADPTRQLLGQTAAPVLGGQVGRQRRTGPVGRERGGDLVAGVGLARRDVDGGAGVDEPLGDHPADAAGPPGHQRRLALDGEEVRAAHGAILPEAARRCRTGPQAWRADMVTKSRAHAGSKKVAGPWTLAGRRLVPLAGEAGVPGAGS